MKKSVFNFMVVVALVAGLASCKKDDSPTYTDFSNGCEAVDLGLKVMWASYNVGANAQEKSGDFFAWGETETKSNYDWTNGGDYKWGVYDVSVSDRGMTKYSLADMKKVLEVDDDPATKQWGTKWRTPTRAEIAELVDKTKCRWEWDATRKGYTVTGIKTGNSIFLPAAGYRNGSALEADGENGAYWSSTLGDSDPCRAYCMDFSSTSFRLSNDNRFYGYSIRAVTQIK